MSVFSESLQKKFAALLERYPERRCALVPMLLYAQEELGHAVSVSELIVDLGGVPTIESEKRVISTDSKKMLEQDLAGEQIAIDLYKELLTIAEEAGEPGIKEVLEEILVKEEEHRRDLLGSLGR